MGEDQNTKALIDFITSRTGLASIGPTAVSILPKDYAVQSLEHLNATPLRPRGNPAFDDVDSFTSFFKRKAASAARATVGIDADGNPIRGPAEDSPESQPPFLVFFQEERSLFTAIFDPDGWRHDIATFTLKHSPEWQRWIKTNATPLDQLRFATFLEDNARDIVDPEAAHMLEIAYKLEAKKSVDFVSGMRLSDGSTEFTYNETTTSKGKMEIPTTFAVNIPVFAHTVGTLVTAKFRYRIQDGGKLNLWYDLDRPDIVAEDAKDAMVALVAERLGVPILRGNAGEPVEKWL
jgi:uncharacterized protein YfdQ (DUF2303 family)